ncbi:disulfide bond formation protein B [Herbaspirillum sp. SJZ107]|uniref:disulfide bond formation protein B n=1 Tax=Herbaspirillum sp. SJZ107 TaxID=2572881 RepID=UPI001153C391|nr:disulfide bond formation protein B [Herbaspirillum sp. SJZ107]TQK05292.1 thiol:disulfide interchange protein DsbB [Herbaspirillum sp. SJZ107]
MPASRKILLLIAAVSLALVGAALYLQHAKDMLPCPLCIIQRYLFLGVAVFSLIAAFAGKVKVWTGVALLSALGGLGVAGKHLYVLAHPGFSCGIDPMETVLNKIPTATLLPWVFRADGLCEAALDDVLGLSVPQWSALWFVILGLSLVWVLARRAR